MQELATAVPERINVVAVVFNDDAYGNVARDLDEAWGGTYGAGLHTPDFMKLADALGSVRRRRTRSGRLLAAGPGASSLCSTVLRSSIALIV